MVGRGRGESSWCMLLSGLIVAGVCPARVAQPVVWRVSDLESRCQRYHHASHASMKPHHVFPNIMELMAPMWRKKVEDIVHTDAHCEARLAATADLRRILRQHGPMMYLPHDLQVMPASSWSAVPHTRGLRRSCFDSEFGRLASHALDSTGFENATALASCICSVFVALRGDQAISL